MLMGFSPTPGGVYLRCFEFHTSGGVELIYGEGCIWKYFRQPSDHEVAPTCVALRKLVFNSSTVIRRERQGDIDRMTSD